MITMITRAELQLVAKDIPKYTVKNTKQYIALVIHCCVENT